MRVRIISLLLLVFLMFISTHNTILVEVDSNTSSHLSYTNHDPIEISNGSDFALQGWPGVGTPSDPYVIEDLRIDSTINCISISDSEVHFIIRNCTIIIIKVLQG